MKHIVVLLVVLLVVSGCVGGTPANAPTPMNTSAPMQAYTPAQDQVLSDCFVYFHLFAWEDTDGDGIWDEEESPLEGVEFYLGGTYASSTNKGRGVSDESGEAVIDTWSPGGCMGTISVNTEPPDGYALTTASPVEHDTSSSVSPTYEFGFRLLEN